MQSFYNSITVRKDSFWLMLWGTCGGAFSTFLQVRCVALRHGSLAPSGRQPDRLRSMSLAA
jgi:hypothetical protein